MKYLLWISLLFSSAVFAQSNTNQVYCNKGTATPCNTSSDAGTGAQGDPAWMAFGKVNTLLETYSQTSAEQSASVTPSNYGYPVGYTLRYGADPTGTNDSTTAIQNAVSVGEAVTMPCGNYELKNTITFSTKSQAFGGPAGRNCVVFKIGTSFNLSASGVFVCNSGEEGPHFHDFTIDFDQSVVASSGTRADLNAYPPAILCQNTPRFTIQNVRIDNAINCLDMRGNSGGAFIDTFETGCYGIGIQIDGSEDGVRIYKWHNWTFGGPITYPGTNTAMTANQESIYNDGNTVGLTSGRMDGLFCDGCVWVNAGVQTKFFTGTGGGQGWATGTTFGWIVNSDWDSYGGLEFEAGQLQITNSYFSEGTNTGSYLIDQTGGNLQVSNSVLSATAQMTNPMVTVDNTSGSPSASQFDNDYVDNINDSAEFLFEGTSPTDAFVRGTYFYLKQNATLSSTAVAVSGSSATLTFVGNRAIPQGTGSSTFLSIGTDNLNVIGHNNFSGRGISLPSPYADTLLAGNAGIASSVTSAWVFDGATNNISIANSGNALLPVGSGAIVVTEYSGGDTAIYTCGSGGCSLVSTANNWVASTSSPTSGKLSVAYNGSSGYAIYNNTGSADIVGVVDLRTRAGN